MTAAAFQRKLLTGLRPHRAQARLLGAVLATLSLHTAALLMAWQAGRGTGLHRASSQPMNPVHLRMAPELSIASIPAAPPSTLPLEPRAETTRAPAVNHAAQERKAHTTDGQAGSTAAGNDHASRPATSAQEPWPNEALDVEPQALEGGLHIQHPDAPLPDGQAEVRLALRLDETGRVEELGLHGRESLPLAFSNAIEAALLNQTLFSPGQLQGRTSRTSLCLGVRFQEGQPPGWELLTQKPTADGHCTDHPQGLAPSAR